MHVDLTRRVSNLQLQFPDDAPMLKRLLLQISVFVLLCTNIHGQTRTWTEESTGRTITATLVERNGDSVVLRNLNGKRFTVAIERFTKADQTYIDEASAKEDKVEHQAASDRGNRLKPSPKPVNVGGLKLKAELLDAGPPITSDDAFGELTQILAVKDQVVVGGKDGTITGFKTNEGASLQVNRAFGDSGVIETGSEVERLLRITDNQVAARLRSGKGLLIESGQIKSDIATPNESTSLDRSGTWGVSVETGSSSAKGFSRVSMLSFNSGELEKTHWITSKDPSAVPAGYTMKNASCAAVIGGDIWIAGLNEEGVQEIVCLDRDRKVQFRLGNKNAFASDGFGNFTAIEETPRGAVVLDSNMRDLKVVSLDGSVTAVVDVKPFLGLSYPWIIDASYNPSDGYLYLLVAQAREKSEVRENLIYRISGFAK
ncbi:SHD1 domain-containing protein [Sulfuriroseicoccus oceanibius]|uniref:SLA1 homology domain-containing protein n=1 Tax=Sulfuriroseicoccus oceanibius TaxID=2707525 RepID=A0A6B3L8T7_9BACT|nr:SHD1 domain-containing protein [Sulfuriroseicoccus oceanibius]QQL45440.1 hypothetical protein G3M56_002275 [Sulfuriroseicoccus oceanibius]